jgi:hypothetical protein
MIRPELGDTTIVANAVDPLNAKLTIATLIVSLVGAFYAVRGFWLKSGYRIRGTWSTLSTVDCDDEFVSNVTLENLKDRAAVIFEIYLQIGHNYYLQIEDFEENPLVLQPFAAFHREYDPIEHYVAGGGSRVNINALLSKKGVRRRLVLSTADGRYVVRQWIRRWMPVLLFFRNHWTGIIHPVRKSFEGKTYGSNIRFVVQLTGPSGKVETVPLRAMDWEISVFRGCKLTREALQSKEALEAFLLEKAVSGELVCADLAVYDLETWRAEAFELERKKPVAVLPEVGWLKYFVLGRVYTWVLTSRTRKANLRRQALRIRKATAALEGTSESSDLQRKPDGVAPAPDANSQPSEPPASE